jgi:excisionase family DNA binding protein
MLSRKEGSTSDAVPPSSPPAPLLTAAEVAERLNISVRSVRRLIKDGRLPIVRIGGSVRIRPEALATLINEGGLG